MSDLMLYFYDDMRSAFEKAVIETDHGLEWKTPYGSCYWNTGGFEIQVGAHRVAWMLENGAIPPGHDVDHDPGCPKTCVTASHLQVLTRSDHAKLGWERGELNGGWGTKRERIYPPKPDSFSWKTDRLCKNSCETLFIPNTSKQIHCSPECATEYQETIRNLRRHPRPDTKVCEEESCQEVFTPKRIDSRFCSRKCLGRNNYKQKAVVREERKCEECPTMFTPLRSGGKFCSQTCGERFRARRRPRIKTQLEAEVFINGEVLPNA